MDTFTDYYTVLGVDSHASASTIKAAFKKLALKYGVTLPADNLRMLIGGDYDFLAHVQAPDDKVVTEFVLAAGMSGYTMPTIMQSFTEAEINDIFSKL